MPEVMPQTPLQWAISEFTSGGRNRRYTLYRDYYDGRHRLAFATQKFRSTFGKLFKEFSENACPAVVEALNDRLKVLGFQTSEAKIEITDVDPPFEGAPSHKAIESVDPFGEDLWDVWNRNNMDVKSTEVHLEALQQGDSYVIVWPDENMQSAIWPQLADQCAIKYDANTEGKVLYGAKAWFDEDAKRWRLNIYLPSQIDKYQMKAASRTFSSKEGSWVPLEVVLNPYEIVPMFHFPNKFCNKPGVSELKDVIPLQDALNKSVMDMLIAMEFASFKQRYIIGVETEIDEETGEPVDGIAKNYGVDRMMTIPDPEAKVGQFEATDLDQFLKVQEKFWASVARVSGTPLHYFFITHGDFPSGEAMKAAEARFIKRISDRQTSFGSIWEKVMLFAAKIDGIEPPVSEENQFSLTTTWTPATPRSESEIADTVVKKKAVGVARSQLLRELGYDEDTITRMLQEADAYEAWVAEMKSLRVTESGQLGPDGKLVDPTKAKPAGNTETNPGTKTGGTKGVKK